MQHFFNQLVFTEYARKIRDPKFEYDMQNNGGNIYYKWKEHFQEKSHKHLLKNRLSRLHVAFTTKELGYKSDKINNKLITCKQRQSPGSPKLS